MKGWLYTTARSVIADYWREQGQLDLLPLSAAEEMPVFVQESSEQMLSQGDLDENRQLLYN